MKNAFTPQEVEIMELLIIAHNKFCQLQSTHPSEATDWQNGIHRLQAVMGLRILRRDYPEEFVTIKNKKDGNKS